MNEIWECDGTADKELVYEFAEILTPTMELAWQTGEDRLLELVQLHTNSAGNEIWIPIQTL